MDDRQRGDDEEPPGAAAQTHEPLSADALTDAEREAQRVRITQALQQMTDASWIRLNRTAQYLAWGLRSCGGEDLLNEGFRRVWEGRRAWPPGVAWLAMMRGTMESVAAHERTSQRRDATRGGSLLMAIEASGRATQSHPDGRIDARTETAKLRAECTADQNVADLLDGLQCEMKQTEVEAATGMTPREYDAARKRLRRLADRFLLSKKGRLQ